MFETIIWNICCKIYVALSCLSDSLTSRLLFCSHRFVLNVSVLSFYPSYNNVSVVIYFFLCIRHLYLAFLSDHLTCSNLFTVLVDKRNKLKNVFCSSHCGEKACPAQHQHLHKFANWQLVPLLAVSPTSKAADLFRSSCSMFLAALATSSSASFCSTV